MWRKKVISKIIQITCDYCGQLIAEFPEIENKKEALREARRQDRKIIVNHGMYFCESYCWNAYKIYKGEI